MRRTRIFVHDASIIQQALLGAVRKLNPRVLAKNPVMFVVGVGSVLTTAAFIEELMLHGWGRTASFDGQISLWLWATILFANYAEALAEGRRVAVSAAPMSMNPIAQAHGSSAGFAKAVWADGELAGMAAVGYGASHLVTAAQLLVLGRHTPESLHAFMFCHPTLDEILKSALTAPQTPVSN